MQTSLSQFQFDMVLQKQLLVIDDKHTDIQVLRDAWFNMCMKVDFELVGSESWHFNRYKYLILQATKDGEVLFFPAKNKNLDENGIPLSGENIIAIQVSHGQMIIVPLHWRYMIPLDMSVTCIGTHDVVTYFLP